ncbi:hypothetical protein [Desulfopila aestuarii]|uniref:hypothetical protein n=1 Tax=Desulfopila aestuarii TaxID=231440 RepID=UPI000937BC57|nr:hypothetical protein [Desulfopila aestuarii]
MKNETMVAARVLGKKEGDNNLIGKTVLYDRIPIDDKWNANGSADMIREGKVQTAQLTGKPVPLF